METTMIMFINKRRFTFHSLNQNEKQSLVDCFFVLYAVVALCSMTFEVMSPRSQSDLRANNLRPKEKRLIIVFSTVDTTKQEVSRTECTEVIADDYATCAVGHDTASPCFKSHLRNQNKKQSLAGCFFATVYW